MRCEGKEYPLLSLGSFSNMKYGKMPKKDMVKENGKYPVFSGYRIVGYCDECNLDKQQLIVVARGVGGTGDVKLSPGACFLTNLSIAVIIDENIALKQYLFYYFQKHNLRYLDSGSAQSQITIADLKNIVLPIPPLEIQSKIVEILSSFDDKIELNNKINENLYTQAKSIFDHYFLYIDYIPDKWNRGNLLDIANFLNGLAMQKFRPQNSEAGLPVLKIKELRQGSCDTNSERCSPSIKPEYIVKDGDVIFSWSGSLLVDIWCGGTCGLNQHLFKVTSDTYDKWFYYMWTAHHLDRFIAIAADKATTMGHIKREELAKAEVLIPSKEDYDKISALMTPIFELIIINRLEARKLANLRDELLPKLMSGQIDVSDILI